ncbi:6-bladed beta-propeller [Acidobacteriota bacterium]
MKRLAYIFCSVLIIGSINCSQKGQQTPETEVIDGVTHIHNPSRPRNPEKSVFLEEDLSIGGTEGEDSSSKLFQPVRMAVHESGTMYIIDRKDWNIKVFSPQGDFIKSFGKTGQGPGEFLFITEMEFMEDGRLLVLDPALRRFSFFSTEGEYFESFQSRDRFTRLLYTTENSFLTDVFIRVESEDVSQSRILEIKEYDLKGSEIRSMKGFKPPAIKVLREGDQFISTEIPYTSQSIFTGDNTRKRLYHCLNDKYVIEVYDRKGILIQKIDRAYDPMPYTKEEADTFKGEILENPNNPLAPRLAEEISLPKVKSVTQWMKIDDRGSLWVQTFEKRMEDGIALTAYDIFDPEGFFDARIWLKYSDEMFGARFKNGYLHILESDPETGLTSFKRYKIIWDSD